MKVKLKECSKCRKPSRLWRSQPPLCKDCAGREKAKEEANIRYKPSMEPQRKVYTIPKKKAIIATISIKRKETLADYRRERDIYMKLYPICEFPDCNEKSTDLHHGAGRTGKLLANPRYFKALCRRHHNWVELCPNEAKEMGISFTRLDK